MRLAIAATASRKAADAENASGSRGATPQSARLSNRATGRGGSTPASAERTRGSSPCTPRALRTTNTGENQVWIRRKNAGLVCEAGMYTIAVAAMGP